MGHHNGWVLGMVIASALSVSVAARAQTGDAPSVTLTNTTDSVVRGPAYDPTVLGLNQFNRQDCVANELVTFNVTIGGSSDARRPYHLEAWIGDDCELPDYRITAAATCTLVGNSAQGVEKLQLSARDLVHASATVSSADDSCAGTSDTPFDETLTFMLVNGDGAAPPAGANWFAKWPYRYDLVGPSAPEMVEVSADDGSLSVSVDQSDAPIDLLNYVFLCAETPQGDPSGSAHTDSNVTCDSTLLSPGEIPNDADIHRYFCGTTSASPPATNGEATPLSNGVRYAVGVVARDSFGNFSPLSELACSTPEAVTNVETSHPKSGGCSLGARRGDTLGVVAMLAALGLVAGRRERRH